MAPPVDFDLRGRQFRRFAEDYYDVKNLHGFSKEDFALMAFSPEEDAVDGEERYPTAWVTKKGSLIQARLAWRRRMWQLHPLPPGREEDDHDDLTMDHLYQTQTQKPRDQLPTTESTQPSPKEQLNEILTPLRALGIDDSRVLYDFYRADRQQRIPSKPIPSLAQELLDADLDEDLASDLFGDADSHPPQGSADEAPENPYKILRRNLRSVVPSKRPAKGVMSDPKRLRCDQVNTGKRNDSGLGAGEEQ